MEVQQMGYQSDDLINIAKVKGWDPTRIQGFSGEEADLANWDKSSAGQGARFDGDGLGRISDAPAVNSGSKPIAARNPAMPGGTGDPSEPSIYGHDSALTWNTPSLSDSRAALKGAETGMRFVDNSAPWNTPDVSYHPPAIGAVGKSRSSSSTPTGGRQ
jgi:hypothetical protein